MDKTTLIVLLALGGAGYYWYYYMQQAQNYTETQQLPTPVVHHGGLFRAIDPETQGYPWLKGKSS